MDCLKDIIGITQSDCPCIVEGLDAPTIQSLADSTSGLYIDEDLEGCPSLKAIKGAFNCKQFAEMALSAKAAAMKKVREDIISGISNKLDKRKESYVGALGDPNFTTPYTPVKDIVGLAIMPVSKTPDATVTLNSINIITFTSISTTVKLFKSYKGFSSGTEVGSWPVTTAPMQQTVVPGFSSMELRMYENGQPVFYYIEYDRMGASVMNNRPTCGCGSVEKILSEFIELSGFEADNMNVFPASRSNFAGGIVANVVIQCKPDNIVCRQYNDEDDVAVQVARAALFMTGIKLIDKLLNLPDINRFTMIQREVLMGKRAHFQKEYNYRMFTTLPSVMNLDASDCYICKQNPAGQPSVTYIPL